MLDGILNNGIVSHWKPLSSIDCQRSIQRVLATTFDCARRLKVEDYIPLVKQRCLKKGRENRYGDTDSSNDGTPLNLVSERLL